MKSIRPTVALVALALAALTTGSGELLAQQMYECITTTHTYTIKVYWTDGTYDIFTWSDSVTKCTPINQA
ncbi:MAG TPA: hypothetical protein VF006_01170 [Longimicrobium sp.]